MHIIIFAKEVMFSSLFVCFSVSNFAENWGTDFHEIFKEGGNAPVNKWLNFGGDPDHRLDTGIGFSDSSPLGDTRRCCAGKAMP